MPELDPTVFAHLQISEVRRRLLKAAVFGKHLTPDQLEHMAEQLAEGLRLYALADTHCIRRHSNSPLRDDSRTQR
ncbi:MAG: hypothetical protein JWN03_2689 [Nocardia sp.]|uniref:DUF6374 family protein n=1 Tax=Nocardia sp. TaxID=1821 RepID=UPI00262641CE|nr:DUF6374 family protein [Nocardia sp.]MCU1642414.1 hypothetical protein [Nocardia sp.]